MADKEKKTTESKSRIIESTDSNDWWVDNFNNILLFFLFLICSPINLLLAIFGFNDTMFYYLMTTELLPADATSWVNVMNEGS